MHNTTCITLGVQLKLLFLTECVHACMHQRVVFVRGRVADWPDSEGEACLFMCTCPVAYMYVSVYVAMCMNVGHGVRICVCDL